MFISCLFLFAEHTEKHLIILRGLYLESSLIKYLLYAVACYIVLPMHNLLFLITSNEWMHWVLFGSKAMILGNSYYCCRELGQILWWEPKQVFSCLHFGTIYTFYGNRRYKGIAVISSKKNYCFFSCKISTYLTWGMMSNIYKPQVFARDLAALSCRMKVPLTS